MLLSRVHKSAAYMTVIFSLGALSMSGAVSPTVSLLMTLSVLLSWFWEPPRIRVERFRLVWNALLLGFIGYTGVLVWARPEELMRPAIDLVLVLVLVKLFQRERARDYIQLYALSFLMMAVSTVMSESLEFGLFFAAYLIMTTIGLSLCHVLGAQEAKGQTSDPIRLTWRTLGLVTGMAVLLVFVSSAFFMLLPRISMGGPQTRETSSSTVGFSTSISLDGHGAIGLSDEVVMRVDMARPTEQLYWRGMAFDHFDGVRWHRSREVRQVTPLRPDASGRYALEGEGGRVRQEIELSPLNADVLLGLTEIRAVSTEGPVGVRVDGASGWHHRGDEGVALRYTAWSAPESTPLEALRGAPGAVPLDVARLYLTLPSMLSFQARELAQKVVEEAGARTPWEKARAIETFLQAKYRYSLDLPKRGPSPVDDFLFAQPWGHCEYFSTTMVMMLRSVGVAARNVNGFNGGEWNSVGRYYLVRKLHAHSWVEVWLPEAGWVTFDPTPPSSIPERRADASGEVGGVSAYMDVLRQRWQRWVVGFSLEEQLAFLREGLSNDEGELSASSVWSSIWEGLSAHWLGWLLLLGVQLVTWRVLKKTRLGVVVLGLAWASGGLIVWLFWGGAPVWPTTVALLVPAYLYWRLRVASLLDRFGRVGPEHPLKPVFEDVLKTLARLDLLGPEPVSRVLPGRLSRRLREHEASLIVEVGELVHRYGEARFREEAPTSGELRALRRDWLELRRRLKRWKRSEAAS